MHCCFISALGENSFPQSLVLKIPASFFNSAQNDYGLLDKKKWVTMTYHEKEHWDSLLHGKTSVFFFFFYSDVSNCS